MTGSPLLTVLVLLVVAVALVPLFKWLGLGTVLGYLAAGVAVGPYGLGLVAESEDIRTVSEFGVVVMLFLIGLEVHPLELWRLRHKILGLGVTQLVGTGLVIALAVLLIGSSWQAALVIGLALAMSSTAIAMQTIEQRTLTVTDTGRATLVTLLVQDIAVIAVLALIPVLAATRRGTPDLGHNLEDAANVVANPFSWWIALVIVGGFVAVTLASRYLMPLLMRWVARAKVPEGFTALGLLLVIGAAFGTSWLGLSPALGAFLAGVLLADSEYRHELESHIEPFKGLLLGLFFMGVGMSLDLRLLAAQPWLVAALVLGVLGLQMVVMWAVGRAFQYSQRASLLLAALLASGGEFAFVVYATGERAQLLSGELAALLKVVVALSMACTPLLVLALAEFADRRAARAAPARPYDELPGERVDVVIAGFGRVGQIPGRLLAAQRIPFTVIEPSSEQVDFSRRFGNKLYYGDPARPEILRAARVGEARVFILALDDPEHSVRVARVLRRLYPQLRVLARARNRQHAFKLMDLGLLDPVRETLLSSLELTRRMLVEIGFDAADARERVERFHAFDARMLVEQHLVYDDESALMQSAEQSRRELLALFEADAAERR